MGVPSKYLENLIDEVSRFPGIGKKSASRIAFHILKMPWSDVERFAGAIISLRENVRSCSVCHGISDSEVCSICSDERRDHSVICAVEKEKDVINIEKTGIFRGVYHVLNGLISPLDGVGPENLNITSLLERCRTGNVKEIIAATNPTIEGDATALYLSKVLKPFGVKIMRIARGLPVGADLDYADLVTIAKSLDARMEME